MSVAESKMPAKIAVGQHTGWAAVHTAKMKGDTVYIRADLVEPLVEALTAILFEDSDKSQIDRIKDRTRAVAALQAYEAAQ